MIISLFIFIILLYFNSIIFIDNFQNNNEEICIKKIDNTNIKLVDHKWKNDFKDRFKGHEPYSNLKMKELLPNLQDDSYIIDVGAHVGDTGLYLAKILKDNYQHKNIKVIHIEPDNSKIDFINKMANKNNLDNIITIPYGVSNKKGNGTIEKKNHPGAWKIKNEENGNIKIDLIDDLCKDKKISLFHIDVEGMEHECLLGSKNILKDTKYVMIELNNIKKRNDEREFLEKNNFKEIKDRKINWENGNVLFEKIGQ